MSATERTGRKYVASFAKKEEDPARRGEKTKKKLTGVEEVKSARFSPPASQ